jgi:hypothetical protein
MNKDSNTKTLDTYLGLCTEVYELSKPDVPRDAYAFYREYAKARVRRLKPCHHLMSGVDRSGINPMVR